MAASGPRSTTGIPSFSPLVRVGQLTRSEFFMKGHFTCYRALISRDPALEKVCQLRCDCSPVLAAPARLRWVTQAISEYACTEQTGMASWKRPFTIRMPAKMRLPRLFCSPWQRWHCDREIFLQGVHPAASSPSNTAAAAPCKPACSSPTQTIRYRES